MQILRYGNYNEMARCASIKKVTRNKLLFLLILVLCIYVGLCLLDMVEVMREGTPSTPVKGQLGRGRGRSMSTVRVLSHGNRTPDASSLPGNETVPTDLQKARLSESAVIQNHPHAHRPPGGSDTLSNRSHMAQGAIIMVSSTYLRHEEPNRIQRRVTANHQEALVASHHGRTIPQNQSLAASNHSDESTPPRQGKLSLSQSGISLLQPHGDPTSPQLMGIRPNSSLIEGTDKNASRKNEKVNKIRPGNPAKREEIPKEAHVSHLKDEVSIDRSIPLQDRLASKSPRRGELPLNPADKPPRQQEATPRHERDLSIRSAIPSHHRNVSTFSGNGKASLSRPAPDSIANKDRADEPKDGTAGQESIVNRTKTDSLANVGISADMASYPSGNTASTTPSHGKFPSNRSAIPQHEVGDVRNRSANISPKDKDNKSTAHTGSDIRIEPITSSKSQDRMNEYKVGMSDNLHANTSICEHIRMMPKGSMPIIALASVPGSGNTWLRHLIERVTGIYTGSVYDDKTLIRGGFLGEAKHPFDGQTVVVKMHRFNRPRKINRTILLVRDLSEAIIAQYNLELSLNESDEHTGVIGDESKYKSNDEFEHCVNYEADILNQILSGIATHVTSFGGKLLVVNYDDLKTDLSNQLRRIVSFLGLPLDEERLRCTLLHAEGNHHRPRHTLSFNPFNEQLAHRVRKAVLEARDIMKKHDLPLLRLKPTISPRIYYSSGDGR